MHIVSPWVVKVVVKFLNKNPSSREHVGRILNSMCFIYNMRTCTGIGALIGERLRVTD